MMNNEQVRAAALEEAAHMMEGAIHSPEWVQRSSVVSAIRALATSAAPERSGGGMITLPIDLVASACYVVRKTGEHDSLLAKLRAYTTGEFSRPADAPVADLHAAIMALRCEPMMHVDVGSASYYRGHAAALRSAAELVASHAPSVAEPDTFGDIARQYKCVSGDVAYKDGYRAGKSGAVPKGWQLVPVEPTDTMREACPCHEYYADIDADWAAMLATAPKSKGGA